MLFNKYDRLVVLNITLNKARARRRLQSRDCSTAAAERRLSPESRGWVFFFFYILSLSFSLSRPPSATEHCPSHAANVLRIISNKREKTKTHEKQYQRYHASWYLLKLIQIRQLWVRPGWFSVKWRYVAVFLYVSFFFVMNRDFFFFCSTLFNITIRNNESRFAKRTRFCFAKQFGKFFFSVCLTLNDP